VHSDWKDPKLPPVTQAEDFWRDTAGDKPNGAADVTQDISRQGQTGIGRNAPAVPQADLDVGGSSVLRVVTLTNLAANGTIGLASATVDIASGARMPQTVAGRTFTIPAPQENVAGRVFRVINTGTVPFTAGGKVIANGTFGDFVWSGTAWVFETSPSALVADFWRSNAGAALPDGNTDTADAIRRTGSTAIGGVITDPVQTVAASAGDPLDASLALSATGERGQVLFGTSPLSYYVTRPVAAAGIRTDVASFNVPHGAHALRFSVSVQDVSFSVTKHYALTTNFNQYGARRLLTPVQDSGPFNAENFECLIQQSNDILVVSLRRASGSIAGTYQIRFEYTGAPTCVMTKLLTTPADVTVYTAVNLTSANDFWRSGAGAVLPDGTNDTTEAVSRTGNVGIGDVPVNTPTVRLDVANGPRSGTDGRLATTAQYVTATGEDLHAGSLTVPLAEFRHTNQTQGVAVAYNGIYATGSSPDVNFAIATKGAGQLRHIWRTISLALSDWWNQAAIVVGGGVQNRLILGPSGGSVTAANHYLGFVQSTGPLQVRQQFDITSNGTLRVAARFEPDLAELGNTSLVVGEQRTNNRKLVLFSSAPTSAHQFYGMGVNAGTYRFQTDGTGTQFSFFAAASAAASNLVFRVAGTGVVQIPGGAPAAGRALICTDAVGNAVWQPTLRRTAQSFPSLSNVPSALTGIGASEFIRVFLDVFGNPGGASFRSAQWTFHIENGQLLPRTSTPGTTFTVLSPTSLQLNQGGGGAYNSRVDLISGVLSYTFIGSFPSLNNFSHTVERFSA
jgi:hypothetical protein